MMRFSLKRQLVNLGIGQGIGRKNANSQSKNLAGVYVAAGIHAYF